MRAHYRSGCRCGRKKLPKAVAENTGAPHRNAVPSLSIFTVVLMLTLTGILLFEPASDAQELRACQLAVPLNISLQGDSPIASAGPDRVVEVDSTVELDGYSSEPSTGATLVNYTWCITPPSQSYQPPFYLYGMNVSFVVNETGLYTANLTVLDSNGLTDWDRAWMSVESKPRTFLEQYWMYLAVLLPAAGSGIYFAAVALGRILKGLPLLSTNSREKLRHNAKRLKEINRGLLKSRMGLAGSILITFFVLMAIFGPWVAPYDVKLYDLENKFEKPSREHLLGTDQVGVDIFSQLLVGARASILIGVFAAIIASFLGAAVGLYSGYVGGWIDELIMRFNDIILAIPWLVLMIVIAGILREVNMAGIIAIIAVTGWSMTARMVRAQVMSLKERQFVERGKAIGAGDLWIIRRYIFPNTFPLVFANTILTVAIAILSEATLSYLKLRPADAITWGKMLSYASEHSAVQIGLTGWIIVPGLCIVFLVLAFSLVGYALDEILNPKLRRR